MNIPEPVTTKMKRIIIAIATLATTGVAMAGTTGTASASSITECGGRTVVSNITTRNVPCYTARRVAVQSGFWGYGTYTRRLGSYRCRARVPNPRSWKVDVRCTSGYRVIRWQYYSGE